MIAVVLQDENGNMLSEQVVVPTNLVSRIGDTRFMCLRFVDPYGDTILNRLQLAPLLEDLRVLRGCSQSDQYEGTFQQIDGLIQLCQAEPHTYIRFIGD